MTLSELIPRPPFQPPQRTDRTAEGLIVEYMNANRGGFRLPIPTEDLKNLIEQHAGDLNLYAEGDELDGDNDGVTNYRRGEKPMVVIAAYLHEGTSEHRLRTTLAHELGHVVLHDPIVQAHWAQGRLLGKDEKVTHVSHRPSLAEEPKGDLIEHQAWYFCGALLIPVNHVTGLIARGTEKAGLFGAQRPESEFGLKAIAAAVRIFDVSSAMARIRLLRLGLLSEATPEPSLF